MVGVMRTPGFGPGSLPSLLRTATGTGGQEADGVAISAHAPAGRVQAAPLVHHGGLVWCGGLGLDGGAVDADTPQAVGQGTWGSAGLPPGKAATPGAGVPSGHSLYSTAAAGALQPIPRGSPGGADTPSRGPLHSPGNPGLLGVLQRAPRHLQGSPHSCHGQPRRCLPCRGPPVGPWRGVQAADGSWWLEAGRAVLGSGASLELTQGSWTDGEAGPVWAW